MKTILLHNPSAGGHGDAPSRDAFLSMLRQSGLEVSLHDSKGKDLSQALAEPARLVLAAGGDGTVGRIATAMAAAPGAAERLLAILPLGTANNLSRALGSWRSPAHFAEGWHVAARRPLNVAVAEAPGCPDRRFVESVGFGAFARAVEHADETGEAGVEAGRAVFQRILSDARPGHARITVDGEAETVETLLVEVMNVALFGPNLVLAPQAEPGDALLDVVTLHPDQRDAMLDWLHAPGSGAPPVTLRRGRKVVVEWPDVPLRLDDTPQEQGAPQILTFHIADEALTVLVPHECLAAPAGARAAAEKAKA
jgi:diacylglycerol kinase family enzyme